MSTGLSTGLGRGKRDSAGLFWLIRTREGEIKKGLQVSYFLATPCYFKWRRHPDLNRGFAVLQTAALPLGYAAQMTAR